MDDYERGIRGALTNPGPNPGYAPYGIGGTPPHELAGGSEYNRPSQEPKAKNDEPLGYAGEQACPKSRFTTGWARSLEAEARDKGDRAERLHRILAKVTPEIEQTIEVIRELVALNILV